MEESIREGENPVSSVALLVRRVFIESRTLEVVRKMGGNFLLKLNIDPRPIANKYREGKVKRTLKRELKVPETARREANETSFFREIVVGIARSVSHGFRQCKLCARVQMLSIRGSLRCSRFVVYAFAAT